MGNYRDLDAWQASRVLAVLTYKVTEQFPHAERYGLTAQMRRAAVSVMSNIAEGTGRGTDTQLAAFLRIARGSLHELENQGSLAVELGFSTTVASEDLLSGSSHTARLLHGLLRPVEARPIR